ncbi:MAG: RNA polymerase sigma-70 factor [Gemmatimonadales bacterium]
MTQPRSPHLPPGGPLQASEGDPAPAFDTLVRKHYGRLCNFAFRFVESREVAEDVVQDVFTHLWQRRENFDIRDPLPYLYQAVRNRAVSHRRGQAVRERWRERTRETDGRHLASAASFQVEATELAEAAARAVAELPARCRLIFTMSREQDLSYAEIAQVLGISVKTVETQMGRALKMLRSRLAGYLSVAFLAASSGRLLG